MFVSKVDLFIITTQNASDMGVKIVIITMNKIIFIRLIDSYTCGVFFLGIPFLCIINFIYQIYRVPNNQITKKYNTRKFVKKSIHVWSMSQFLIHHNLLTVQAINIVIKRKMRLSCGCEFIIGHSWLPLYFDVVALYNDNYNSTQTRQS